MRNKSLPPKSGGVSALSPGAGISLLGNEITRRNFLKFLGGGAAAAACSALLPLNLARANGGFFLAFTPVRLPHPLPINTVFESFLATGIDDGITLEGDPTPELASYRVIDDVIVPPEFERYVILAWGDRIFPNPHDYVGYNHDYTAYIPLEGKRDGLLWVNHEYVSPPFSPLAPNEIAIPANVPTGSSFEAIIGFPLPNEKNREFLGECLYNCGGTIARIRRNRFSDFSNRFDRSGQVDFDDSESSAQPASSGKSSPSGQSDAQARSNRPARAGGSDRFKSPARFKVVEGDGHNRRIHGLSGLAINAERTDGYQGVTSWASPPLPHQQGDTNYLVGTGPAAVDVFEGVDSDGLGNRIIGTAFNCSGATTPWGTVLSAEENFQGSSTFFVGVQEGVKQDGSQTGYTPGTTGAEFGQVGEKYGWMVEIYPLEPGERPRKHTCLGRFRHENAALRVSRNDPLVVYLGDDRRGGHVWKFVSTHEVLNPKGPDNSLLFEEGTLFVAKFKPDGTGIWIPLLLSTPTDPNSPTAISQPQFDQEGVRDRNGLVKLPRRAGTPLDPGDGGFTNVDTTNEAAKLPFYQNKTLADFYDSQGALLCDAFAAANLVGGTPCGRPEDVEIHPRTKEVFIAMTDNVAGSDGYADARIFQVSKYAADPGASQPSGGLYKITENSSNGAGITFRWERFVQGGEAGTLDGVGFANVDNLLFDRKGNLWGVTDMSTGSHNALPTGLNPTPSVLDHNAVGSSTAARLVGAFGNNWMFFVPTSGPAAGLIVPFAYGPTRCEMTGPTFVGDTLILAVQHPGEEAPIGPENTGPITLDIELLSLGGGLFTQQRTVPFGSIWPSSILGESLALPKPAVIGIHPKRGDAPWENDD
jgi:secreted PhoX family phosphatase